MADQNFGLNYIVNVTMGDLKGLQELWQVLQQFVALSKTPLEYEFKIDPGSLGQAGQRMETTLVQAADKADQKIAQKQKGRGGRAGTPVAGTPVAQAPTPAAPPPPRSRQNNQPSGPTSNVTITNINDLVAALANTTIDASVDTSALNTTLVALAQQMGRLDQAVSSLTAKLNGMDDATWDPAKARLRAQAMGTVAAPMAGTPVQPVAPAPGAPVAMPSGITLDTQITNAVNRLMKDYEDELSKNVNDTLQRALTKAPTLGNTKSARGNAQFSQYMDAKLQQAIARAAATLDKEAFEAFMLLLRAQVGDGLQGAVDSAAERMGQAAQTEAKKKTGRRKKADAPTQAAPSDDVAEGWQIRAPKVEATRGSQAWDVLDAAIEKVNAHWAAQQRDQAQLAQSIREKLEQRLRRQLEQEMRSKAGAFNPLAGAPVGAPVGAAPRPSASSAPQGPRQTLGDMGIDIAEARAAGQAMGEQFLATILPSLAGLDLNALRTNNPGAAHQAAQAAQQRTVVGTVTRHGPGVSVEDARFATKDLSPEERAALRQSVELGRQGRRRITQEESRRAKAVRERVEAINAVEGGATFMGNMRQTGGVVFSPAVVTPFTRQGQITRAQDEATLWEKRATRANLAAQQARAMVERTRGGTWEESAQSLALTQRSLKGTRRDLGREISATEARLTSSTLSPAERAALNDQLRGTPEREQLFAVRQQLTQRLRNRSLTAEQRQALEEERYGIEQRLRTDASLGPMGLRERRDRLTGRINALNAPIQAAQRLAASGATMDGQRGQELLQREINARMAVLEGRIARRQPRLVAAEYTAQHGATDREREQASRRLDRLRAAQDEEQMQLQDLRNARQMRPGYEQDLVNVAIRAEEKARDAAARATAATARLQRLQAAEAGAQAAGGDRPPELIPGRMSPEASRAQGIFNALHRGRLSLTMWRGGVRPLDDEMRDFPQGPDAGLDYVTNAAAAALRGARQVVRQIAMAPDPKTGKMVARISQLQDEKVRERWNAAVNIAPEMDAGDLFTVQTEKFVDTDGRTKFRPLPIPENRVVLGPDGAPVMIDNGSGRLMPQFTPEFEAWREGELKARERYFGARPDPGRGFHLTPAVIRNLMRSEPRMRMILEGLQGGVDFDRFYLADALYNRDPKKFPEARDQYRQQRIAQGLDPDVAPQRADYPSKTTTARDVFGHEMVGTTQEDVEKYAKSLERVNSLLKRIRETQSSAVSAERQAAKAMKEALDKQGVTDPATRAKLIEQARQDARIQITAGAMAPEFFALRQRAMSGDAEAQRAYEATAPEVLRHAGLGVTRTQELAYNRYAEQHPLFQLMNMPQLEDLTGTTIKQMRQTFSGLREEFLIGLETIRQFGPTGLKLPRFSPLALGHKLDDPNYMPLTPDYWGEMSQAGVTREDAVRRYAARATADFWRQRIDARGGMDNLGNAQWIQNMREAEALAATFTPEMLDVVPQFRGTPIVPAQARWQIKSLDKYRARTASLESQGWQFHRIADDPVLMEKIMDLEASTQYRLRGMPDEQGRDTYRVSKDERHQLQGLLNRIESIRIAGGQWMFGQNPDWRWTEGFLGEDLMQQRYPADQLSRAQQLRTLQPITADVADAVRTVDQFEKLQSEMRQLARTSVTAEERIAELTKRLAALPLALANLPVEVEQHAANLTSAKRNFASSDAAYQDFFRSLGITTNMTDVAAGDVIKSQLHGAALQQFPSLAGFLAADTLKGFKGGNLPSAPVRLPVSAAVAGAVSGSRDRAQRELDALKSQSEQLSGELRTMEAKQQPATAEQLAAARSRIETSHAALLAAHQRFAEVSAPKFWGLDKKAEARAREPFLEQIRAAEIRRSTSDAPEHRALFDGLIQDLTARMEARVERLRTTPAPVTPARKREIEAARAARESAVQEYNAAVSAVGQLEGGIDAEELAQLRKSRGHRQGELDEIRRFLLDADTNAGVTDATKRRYLALATDKEAEIRALDARIASAFDPTAYQETTARKADIDRQIASMSQTMGMDLRGGYAASPRDLAAAGGQVVLPGGIKAEVRGGVLRLAGGDTSAVDSEASTLRATRDVAMQELHRLQGMGQPDLAARRAQIAQEQDTLERQIADLQGQLGDKASQRTQLERNLAEIRGALNALDQAVAARARELLGLTGTDVLQTRKGFGYAPGAVESKFFAENRVVTEGQVPPTVRVGAGGELELLDASKSYIASPESSALKAQLERAVRLQNYAQARSGRTGAGALTRIMQSVTAIAVDQLSDAYSASIERDIASTLRPGSGAAGGGAGLPPGTYQFPTAMPPGGGGGGAGGGAGGGVGGGGGGIGDGAEGSGPGPMVPGNVVDVRIVASLIPLGGGVPDADLLKGLKLSKVDLDRIERLGKVLEKLNFAKAAANFDLLGEAIERYAAKWTKLPASAQHFGLTEAKKEDRRDRYNFEKDVVEPHRDARRAARNKELDERRQARQQEQLDIETDRSLRRVRERITSASVREASERRILALRRTNTEALRNDTSVRERTRRVNAQTIKDLERMNELAEKNVVLLKQQQERRAHAAGVLSAATAMPRGIDAATQAAILGSAGTITHASPMAKFFGATNTVRMGGRDVSVEQVSSDIGKSIEGLFASLARKQQALGMTYRSASVAESQGEDTSKHGKRMRRLAQDMDAINAMLLEKIDQMATIDPSIRARLGAKLAESQRVMSEIKRLELARFEALQGRADVRAALDNERQMNENAITAIESRKKATKDRMQVAMEEVEAQRALERAERELSGGRRLRGAQRRVEQAKSALAQAEKDEAALSGSTDRKKARAAKQERAAAEQELQAAQAQLTHVRAQLGQEVQAATRRVEALREHRGGLLDDTLAAQRAVQGSLGARDQATASRETAQQRMAQGLSALNGIPLTDVNDELETLRKNHTDVTSAIKDETAAVLEAARGYKHKANMIDNLGDKMRSLAMYMGGGFLVYGVTFQIAQMVREVIALESAMASIQGIFENKTLQERLMIQEGVIQAAKDYGLALQDVAQTAKIFAQTGQGAEAALRNTRAVSLGVQGAGLDPAQATEMVIAVSNLTDDRVTAERMMDRISLVEAKHAVTSQDLSHAIQRVGALAVQMQPGQLGNMDAFDAIMGMTTQIVEATRVSGAQASTSLRFMLARLSAPRVAGQLQERFGLKLAGETPGEMRPLTDILTDLSKIYKDLTNPDREGGPDTIRANQLLQTFAGARQINAAAALLEGWNKAMEVAQESALAFGDAQRRLAIQMDTVAAQLTSTRNAFIEFFNALLTQSGAMGATKGVLRWGRGMLETASDNPMQSLVGMGLAGTVVTGAMFPASRYLGRVADRRLATVAGTATSSMGGLVTVMRANTAARSLGLMASVFRLLASFINPLMVVLTAAGLIGTAISAWRNRRQEAQLDQDKYGPSNPNLEQIEDSELFTGFAEKARGFGLSGAGLRDEVVRLAAAAQANVLQRPEFAGQGEALFRGEATNPRLSRALEEELLKLAQESEALHGLTDLGDSATQLAEVLALVKDTAIMLDAAMGFELSFMREQFGARNTAVLDNFRQSMRKLVPTQPGQVRSGGPDTVTGNPLTFLRMMFDFDWGMQALGLKKRDPNLITGDDLTTELGPGLAYNRLHARAVQRGSGPEMVEDVGAIINALTDRGGAALLNDRVSVRFNGQTISGAVQNVVAQMLHMENGAKSLGQAIDTVVVQLYKLTEEEAKRVNEIKAQIAAERKRDNLPVLGATELDRAYVQRTGGTTPEGEKLQRLIDLEDEMYNNLAAQFGVQDRFQRITKNQAQLDGAMTSTGGNELIQLIVEREQRAQRALLADMERASNPEAQQLRAWMETHGRPENRMAQLADISSRRGSGRSVVRDRLLEFVLRDYQEQDTMLRTAAAFARSGIGEIDVVGEAAQSSVTAVRQYAAIFSQMRADMIRAGARLRDFDELPGELLDEQLGEDSGDRPERSVIPLAQRAVLVAGSRAALERQTPEARKNLQSQYEQFQQAFAELSSDESVFSKFSADEQKFIQSVVSGGHDLFKSDDALRLTFMAIGEILERRAKLDQDRLGTQNQELENAKALRELDVQRLEATHARAQAERDLVQRRAEIMGGPAATTAFRVRGTQAEFAEQAAVIRAERDKALRDLADNKTMLDGERQGEVARILNQANQRLAAAADQRDLELRRLMGGAELDVLAARRESAFGLGNQALGGLRGVLASGYTGMRELEKTGEGVGPAIFGAIGDAIRERLADNLIEALIGPQGLFADQMEIVFGNQILQEQELFNQQLQLEAAQQEQYLVSEHEAIVSAFQAGSAFIEQAMKMAGVGKQAEVPTRAGAAEAAGAAAVKAADTAAKEAAKEATKAVTSPPTAPTGGGRGGLRSDVPASRLIGHEDAVAAAGEFLKSRGKQGVITSATRTYAEQVDLYRRDQAGDPHVYGAAKPGTSPHEFGRAMDIWVEPSIRNEFVEFMRSRGYTWAGPSDPVHFTKKTEASMSGLGAMLQSQGVGPKVPVTPPNPNEQVVKLQKGELVLNSEQALALARQLGLQDVHLDNAIQKLMQWQPTKYHTGGVVGDPPKKARSLAEQLEHLERLEQQRRKLERMRAGAAGRDAVSRGYMPEPAKGARPAMPTIGPDQTGAAQRAGQTPLKLEGRGTTRYIGQEGYQLQDIVLDALGGRESFGSSRFGTLLQWSQIPGVAQAGQTFFEGAANRSVLGMGMGAMFGALELIPGGGEGGKLLFRTIDDLQLDDLSKVAAARFPDGSIGRGEIHNKAIFEAFARAREGGKLTPEELAQVPSWIMNSSLRQESPIQLGYVLKNGQFITKADYEAAFARLTSMPEKDLGSVTISSYLKEVFKSAPTTPTDLIGPSSTLKNFLKDETGAVSPEDALSIGMGGFLRGAWDYLKHKNRMRQLNKGAPTVEPPASAQQALQELRDASLRAGQPDAIDFAQRSDAVKVVAQALRKGTTDTVNVDKIITDDLVRALMTGDVGAVIQHARRLSQAVDKDRFGTLGFSAVRWSENEQKMLDYAISKQDELLKGKSFTWTGPDNQKATITYKKLQQLRRNFNEYNDARHADTEEEILFHQIMNLRSTLRRAYGLPPGLYNLNTPKGREAFDQMKWQEGAHLDFELAQTNPAAARAQAKIARMVEYARMEQQFAVLDQTFHRAARTVGAAADEAELLVGGKPRLLASDHMFDNGESAHSWFESWVGAKDAQNFHLNPNVNPLTHLNQFTSRDYGHWAHDIEADHGLRPPLSFEQTPFSQAQHGLADAGLGGFMPRVSIPRYMDVLRSSNSRDRIQLGRQRLSQLLSSEQGQFLRDYVGLPSTGVTLFKDDLLGHFLPNNWTGAYSAPSRGGTDWIGLNDFYLALQGWDTMSFSPSEVGRMPWTFAHEFGHRYALHTNPQAMVDFERHVRGRAPQLKYAQTNADEHFAEAFAAADETRRLLDIRDWRSLDTELVDWWIAGREKNLPGHGMLLGRMLQHGGYNTNNTLLADPKLQPMRDWLFRMAEHTGGALPKFHTGGVARDELMAVLQKGEVVFTPDQLQALVGALSTVGASDKLPPIVFSPRPNTDTPKVPMIQSADHLLGASASKALRERYREAYLDKQMRDFTIQQARQSRALMAATQYAANFGGTLLGEAVSPHGKGNNHAATGASIGQMVAPAVPQLLTAAGATSLGAKLGFLGGPVGALVGAGIGGLIGGLFGKKEKVEVQFAQAERIERNTRQAVTAIENQNRNLLSFENVMRNVPASFVLPGYRPMTSGGTTVNNEVHVTVDASQTTDPQAVGRMVAQEIRQQLKTVGSYTTFKY